MRYPVKIFFGFHRKLHPRQASTMWRTSLSVITIYKSSHSSLGSASKSFTTPSYKVLQGYYFHLIFEPNPIPCFHETEKLEHISVLSLTRRSQSCTDAMTQMIFLVKLLDLRYSCLHVYKLSRSDLVSIFILLVCPVILPLSVSYMLTYSLKDSVLF